MYVDVYVDMYWRVTWSVLGHVRVSMLIGKEVSLEASGNRHVFSIP